MSSDDKSRITIERDGPYKVSGTVPLDKAVIACNEAGESVRWERGKRYETGGKDYLLCRCGSSDHRPFCDGTHAKVHFQGREKPETTPYQERARRYAGPELDLLDDASLCVSARFCDRDGTVWRQVHRTEDPVVRQEVIEAVCRCPSGRLTVVDKQGAAIEPPLEASVSLVEDPLNDFRGPLWVQGGITVQDAEGNVYERRNRVTLCRCGASGNMPFCDASHYKSERMRGLDQ